jgi:hypothetical protein
LDKIFAQIIVYEEFSFFSMGGKKKKKDLSDQLTCVSTANNYCSDESGSCACYRAKRKQLFETSQGFRLKINVKVEIFSIFSVFNPKLVHPYAILSLI